MSRLILCACFRTLRDWYGSKILSVFQIFSLFFKFFLQRTSNFVGELCYTGPNLIHFVTNITQFLIKLSSGRIQIYKMLFKLEKLTLPLNVSFKLTYIKKLQFILYLLR